RHFLALPSPPLRAGPQSGRQPALTVPERRCARATQLLNPRRRRTAGRRAMMRCLSPIGILVPIVLAIGCAGSANQPAVVSGKVTLSGAPVTAGTVLFMTDDGQAASAELKSDGTYVLHAQPSRFKVAVTPPPAPDPLA